MAKSESKVKTEMVAAVKRAKGYARRIEDQYSVGMPDCVFIMPNTVPCFTEVKIVRDNIYGPTDRQLIELQRIVQASTKVAAAVVGWKDGVYYIASPQSKIDIRYEFVLSDTDFPRLLERYLK